MNMVNTNVSGFTPATDILEMEDGFHILMDMPGVLADDLIVDIEERELTIKGVSAYKPAEENMRCIHSEFGGYTYKRSFTLSDMVDVENVKATLRNGVLELYLPKAEAMKPVRINIT